MTEPGTSLGRGFTHWNNNGATFALCRLGVMMICRMTFPTATIFFGGMMLLSEEFVRRCQHTQQRLIIQIESSGDIEPNIRLGTGTITPNRIDTLSIELFIRVVVIHQRKKAFSSYHTQSTVLKKSCYSS